MKQVVRGLMLSALAASSVGAKVYGDRTYMNHRDELSDSALNWAGTHHYNVKADDKNLGATIMVSPFYSKTTNHEDIAKLLGQGTTGKIAVLKTGETGDGLFGENIDHSPGTDFTEKTNLPMYGTVTLKPEREAYGASLSWNQSLESLLAGLSLQIDTPLVQANTNMNMSATGATASDVPANSGTAGKTLANYFGGSLSKAISGNVTHVKQDALKKAKLSSKKQGKFSVGDVHVGLNWQFLKRKKFNVTAGVNLVLPTGNSATGEWVFESMVGNGGHTMLGASLGGNFKAVCKKNLSVDLHASADWRYGFEASVKRTLGVQKIATGALEQSGHYQMMMQHKTSGVFPGANVLTKDCNVTIGHQLDAIVGLSGSFRCVKFDLGYNLFAREREKVELKEKWSDDTYAFAHSLYSMQTTALPAETVIGGQNFLYNDATPAVSVKASGETFAGNNYADPTAPTAKHSHLIGSMDTEAGSLASYGAFDDGAGDATDHIYPGGHTSAGGPIQNIGRVTSALAQQDQLKAAAPNNTGVTADRTPAATLTPVYSLSTAPCVTESQLTHSVFGSLSCQLQGDFPIIIGVGGKVELQDSDHNSALEKWTVFGKLGITF